jgi:GrpB-like predicted nucleotidyltransferase (UPF0157 family)
MRDDLGLDKAEVRLSPHNPGWMVLGREECAAVEKLLGPLAVSVVHVGSTSIPGIDAKPILDIAAAVDDNVPIEDVIAALCDDGAYIYEGDRRQDGGLLFVRGHGSVRTVHVHVVEQSSAAWKAYLRFHALLLNDAVARERYQSVKRDLARRYPQDRDGYTEAKRHVIEELLASADPRPH